MSKKTQKNIDGELTWNYRIVLEKRASHTEYSLREVFYKNGKPISCTADWCAPFGETPHEFRQDFDLMKQAFTRPILTLTGNKLI